MAQYNGDLMHEMTKDQVAHAEAAHDKAYSNDSDTENALRNELSVDELALEKKLKRKIDSIIMPMVVLVRRANTH
jgi:hypothetical protein